MPTLNRVDPTAIATSGPLLLAAGVALLAGMVSFASPCVVPLVPGYLAYLAALVGADAPDEKGKKARVLGAVALFVLGFTVVFAAGIGGLLYWLGDAILANQDLLQRIGGVLIIAMALVFVGLVPGMQKEIRFHARPRMGLAGAPVLGAIFGLGWTPCIGPTLSAITTLSFSESTAGRGALLSAVYALGLGLPFILAGLAYERALSAVGWVRRHQVWVMRAGGLMLVAVGLLLVTGWWDQAVTWLQLHLVNSSETVV